MPRRAQHFPSCGAEKRVPHHDVPTLSAEQITVSEEPLDAVSVAELPHLISDWLADSEYRQHTAATISARRVTLGKLVWFARHRQFETVGLAELRQFFAYLKRGHEEPGGRWGNPHQTKPMRPVTVHTYHAHLRSFFGWLVEDATLAVSPMTKIAAPIVRTDQIQPLSPEDIAALFRAVKISYNPIRNEAILLLLLDCGLRASELCSLKIKDVDLENRRLVVLGKGCKYRAAFLGREVTKALRKYLRVRNGLPEAPLFTSDGGISAFEALKRRGLHMIIQKLGKAAGIQSVRCSPHTLRHTFAVEFLRGGGNVFTLKELLSHNNLTMTNRYVLLAEADLENQHRQFSPADRLRPHR